ncbi:hypothetical protein OUZ56_030329 [Daphnia magna]|uniref:Uncharacterized protein n=1 Tax=Daphnia magna TaxID=35525 RepID=A0ABQ9ZQZ6_9CRUS|nr:hypothetical protein OUZ56_030329 [Daphnia magna]
MQGYLIDKNIFIPQRNKEVPAAAVQILLQGVFKNRITWSWPIGCDTYRPDDAYRLWMTLITYETNLTLEQNPDITLLFSLFQLKIHNELEWYSLSWLMVTAGNLNDHSLLVVEVVNLVDSEPKRENKKSH